MGVPRTGVAVGRAIVAVGARVGLADGGTAIAVGAGIAVGMITTTVMATGWGAGLLGGCWEIHTWTPPMIAAARIKARLIAIAPFVDEFARIIARLRCPFSYDSSEGLSGRPVSGGCEHFPLIS
jgi:hypothetical protein